jgi:hypothetical protein
MGKKAGKEVSPRGKFGRARPLVCYQERAKSLFGGKVEDRRGEQRGDDMIWM